MINISLPLIRPMKCLAFSWLIASILTSTATAARECRFYTDAAGRRRRTCYGLLPGIIAAVVVGVIVILAFASLAWILRRRRQRENRLNQPVFTHESVNNLMSQQPPSYPPPPNYPLATMQNQPINPPAQHNLEKHQSEINDPVQAPHQASLSPHNPNQ